METTAPSEEGAAALSEEETNAPAEPVVEDEPPLQSGPEGSGYCGVPGNEKSVEWKFDWGTGILTISGTGDMQNCGSYPPWYDIMSEYMSQKNKTSKAVVGEGVTSIGDSAFEDCYMLAEITLPGSVKSIGKRAFSGCRRLEKINLSEGITGIGEKTFYNCSKLTEITLPNSVTSIGNNAFQNSGLTKIDLPESVTSIGKEAFWGCSSLTEINMPGVTDIGDRAFASCKSLTEMDLSGKVTSMGDGLFSDCSSLTKVTLPGSVASIGNSIFAGCKSLAKVTIPEGVTSIGNEVFWACDSLAELTLPATLTETGTEIFRGCDSLKDINYGGTMSGWGKIKAAQLMGEDSKREDTTIDKLWSITETTIHCSDGTIINARTWDRYSRERMQEIAELSKSQDVSIATADGVTYTFKKGDFNLTEDREEYKFGVTLHQEISGSGVDISVAAAEDFAVCIDYYYDGQLPGTAQISIPVDPKWNGKTLYYYQVKDSRTLEDTGVSAVVADGVCKVNQTHCSKYVLLTKTPEELGVDRYTDDSQKPTPPPPTDNGGEPPAQPADNGGEPPAQPADNGGTTQAQPTDNTSPKIILAQTGDSTNITVYVVLMILAAGGGVFALARVRRKHHDM